MIKKSSVIAVVGLGYVGLPLAVEFGKSRAVIGFDVNSNRITELSNGKDSTLEVEFDELVAAEHLTFTNNPDELSKASVYIVTVPTPIDQSNHPDLIPLIKASEMIGKKMNTGDTVIYESTVYPGCTEEVCVPILERESGLIFNEDFYCGYSPERINPGDREHRLPSIRKVTSGSTPEAARAINELYEEIIVAGTFMASNIKVAEAAKVIENTQRDVNIALMNELAIIFGKLNIDTQSVLEAAATKWNFLKFSPGLVGGHCIGVDPYYLTYKAQSVGHHPEIILSGRRVNDGMGLYFSSQIIRLMIKRSLKVQDAKVLILGLSFKENCPDIRNTKVVDIVTELGEYGADVEIYDPWVSKIEALEEYGIKIVDRPKENYDAIVLAVPHHQFLDWGAQEIRKLGNNSSVLIDIKGVLPIHDVDLRF